MILLEVHDGLFQDPCSISSEHHHGWRFITPCTGPLPRLLDANQQPRSPTIEDIVEICPLFLDAAEFTDDNYRIFMILLHKLLATSKSTTELTQHMGQDIHDAGDIVIQRESGKNEKHSIVQFGKKRTLVRIHTITNAAGRRLAFISHTFVKPANSDKTPSAQKKRCKSNLQNFYIALDEKTAELITEQGGRNGFQKLVS